MYSPETFCWYNPLEGIHGSHFMQGHPRLSEEDGSESPAGRVPERNFNRSSRFVDSYRRAVNTGRGTIADTIASARASLKNPSRPFTPADPLRRLNTHALVNPNDNVIPPPTPLLSTGSFELERPFTGIGKVPLPSTRQALDSSVVSSKTASENSGIEARKTQHERSQSTEVLTILDDSTASGEEQEVFSSTRRPRSSSETSATSALWQNLRSKLRLLENQNLRSNACDEICELLPNKDVVMSLETAQRSEVVKSVAKHMDSKDPNILTKLAKVVVIVTKGGSNLLSASKLLFRLSKVPDNDLIFRSNGIFDTILQTLGSSGKVESVVSHISRLSDQCEAEVEALMYLIGVLKNCSSENDENRNFILKSGALPVVTAWIRAFSRLERQIGQNDGSVATAEESAGRFRKMEEHITSFLTQATVLLRNLATVSSYRDDFVAFGAVRAVVEVLSMWENDAELLLNASRVVSKLSLTKSCQEEMASISGFHESFIQVIARHQDRAPLLIRLTFVLGNLTSSDEEHRMKIFGCRNSLDIVLDILYTHGQLLISAAEELETKIEQSVSPTNEASPADVNELSKHASQDLLVKVVRLLAHLAISPDVGPVLATKEKIEMLIMLANTINIVYCEELILNVVSAITNLSYYSGEDSIIWQTRMELVKILSEMLFVENQEAVLEATRAFGNLSRDQDARRLMHSSRIDEALVLLLDHSDRDVLAASAGVVVNLAADPSCLDIQMQSDALVLLMEALGRSGTSDSELCCTICYALYNLATTMEWRLDGLVAMNLQDVLEELLVQARNSPEELATLMSVMERLLSSIKNKCREEIRRVQSELQGDEDSDEEGDEGGCLLVPLEAPTEDMTN